MLKLYEYPSSGNSYKVHLLIHELGLPHENQIIDILEGESRTPEFLKLNPNGRIPVLELDDGRTIAESNAILWYLAEGTALLPEDPFDRAKVLEWMSFEQHNLEPTIAEVRFWLHLLGQSPDELGARYTRRMEAGYAALEIVEKRLQDRQWLVGDQFTIADIALFGYTHVSEEGGFSLENYPAIRSWIDAVRARPNFIEIEE